MLQLKFFFLGALIAGLKGVECFPPIEGKPGETFSAGLSPARVDENYYDNQARATPVEEDDNELRALQFVEPEARLTFDQARFDESDYCFMDKYSECRYSNVRYTDKRCINVANRKCRQ